MALGLLLVIARGPVMIAERHRLSFYFTSVTSFKTPKQWRLLPLQALSSTALKLFPLLRCTCSAHDWQRLCYRHQMALMRIRYTALSWRAMLVAHMRRMAQRHCTSNTTSPGRAVPCLLSDTATVMFLGAHTRRDPCSKSRDNAAASEGQSCHRPACPRSAVAGSHGML